MFAHGRRVDQRAGLLGELLVPVVLLRLQDHRSAAAVDLLGGAAINLHQLHGHVLQLAYDQLLDNAAGILGVSVLSYFLVVLQAVAAVEVLGDIAADVGFQ